MLADTGVTNSGVAMVDATAVPAAGERQVVAGHLAVGLGHTAKRNSLVCLIFLAPARKVAVLHFPRVYSITSECAMHLKVLFAYLCIYCTALFDQHTILIRFWLA